MLVLAAVSDMQYQRLRGAVAPGFSLARAPTWDDALETIRVRPSKSPSSTRCWAGRGPGGRAAARVVPFTAVDPVHADDDTELAPVLLAMGSAASVRSC